MFYIQENDKLNRIDKLFRRIHITGNRILLPIEMKEKKLTEKKQEQLAIKTIKLLRKSTTRKVVVSKKVGECEKYINKLEQENYKNITGKWLYKMLVPEILEYILKKEGRKKEETGIYILVNDITDVVIQTIKEFAKEYKAITIITNHIDKFKKIEESIYEELGIYITAINHKKKSLSRAKIIINFDFPKELINQYVIYEKAIIINIPGKLKINKKRYEGKIIQGYEIKTSKNIEEEQEYNQEDEKFYPKAIYEAKFYQEQPYLYVKEKIHKDKIEIKELYLQNETY